MVDRLLYPVNDAAERLSMGRTRFFEKIRSGEIESVQIGRRRLVPAAALDEYVARLRAEQTDTPAS
jgi:excisionase family DNA binding protein